MIPEEYELYVDDLIASEIVSGWEGPVDRCFNALRMRFAARHNYAAKPPDAIRFKSSTEPDSLDHVKPVTPPQTDQQFPSTPWSALSYIVSAQP